MKAWILTMAYANPRVFKAGAASLRETVDFTSTGAHHVILDQHYPLERPGMCDALTAYSMRYAKTTTILDAGKNLGLHEGLNFMIRELAPVLSDDDIIVGYDPDEAPQRDGWLSAMLAAFSDPKIGWLSLMCPAANEVLDKQGCKDFTVDDGGFQVRVRSPNYALINTVCAWRYSIVKKLGRFDEPHAFYGGLEVAMMPKFWQHGYLVGWLADYYTANHRHLADPTYEQYKRRHVGHEEPVFPGSFEEWLKQ